MKCASCERPESRPGRRHQLADAQRRCQYGAANMWAPPPPLPPPSATCSQQCTRNIPAQSTSSCAFDWARKNFVRAVRSSARPAPSCLHQSTGAPSTNLTNLNLARSSALFELGCSRSPRPVSLSNTATCVVALRELNQIQSYLSTFAHRPILAAPISLTSGTRSLIARPQTTAARATRCCCRARRNNKRIWFACFIRSEL